MSSNQTTLPRAATAAQLAKRARYLERLLPMAGDAYESVWAELVSVRRAQVSALQSAKP